MMQLVCRQLYRVSRACSLQVLHASWQCWCFLKLCDWQYHPMSWLVLQQLLSL